MLIFQGVYESNLNWWKKNTGFLKQQSRKTLVFQNPSILLVCLCVTEARHGKHSLNTHRKQGIKKKEVGSTHTNVPWNYGIDVFSHHGFFLFGFDMSTARNGIMGWPSQSHSGGTYSTLPEGTNIDPPASTFEDDDFPFPLGGICIRSLDGNIPTSISWSIVLNIMSCYKNPLRASPLPTKPCFNMEWKESFELLPNAVRWSSLSYKYPKIS